MNRKKIRHWSNTSKNYKKGFVFLVTMTLKDNHKSFPKANKAIFTSVSFKANASVYYNASQYYGAIKAFKGKDTLWNFSFRAFHEIQFQGHFMKREILSWNTFTLVSNIHYVCFSSIKIVFAEKRYRVENSKIPKRIWMKPCLKTRSDKSTCANIFLELPLTI